MNIPDKNIYQLERDPQEKLLDFFKVGGTLSLIVIVYGLLLFALA